MPTRTVDAKIDAFTREDRGGKNFRNTPYLNLNGAAGSLARAYVYVRPPFDRGSDVNVPAATLRAYLRGAGWAGGPHTITARRISERWTERGITYNDAPAVDGAVVTVDVTDGVDGQVVELDVASLVQDFATGSPFYGIRLEVNTAGGKRLHSTETVARGGVDGVDSLLTPELEVTWNRAPAVSTDLRPAGGRSIGTATPRLAWNYHSALGEKSQTHSRIQVSTVSDFSSIHHDTGWVANTTTEHLYGGAALVAATLYYWRVDVRDESGRESGFSDPASFRYEAHEALAILTGATVDDPSPTITWTFPNQKAFAYVLYQSDGDGGWVEIWRSGRKTTGVTEVTIPRRTIRQEGVEYRGRLRAWDTKDRENTADKDFVQAFHVFTYVRSGVPAAVTALTGVVDGPAIVLAWERTAQPDHFAVKIGTEIVDEVDAEDALVAGTSYQYRFYGARPGGDKTIGVEAVASGKHSNPTEVVVAYEVIGVWLIHEQTGTEAVIHGEAPDTSIGKSAGRYDLEGARAPVILTSGVRGYEGRARGIQVFYEGQAAKEWRNRIEKIVGLASRGDLRLIYLDYSYRIDLDADNVGIRALSEFADAWEVDFSFVQVDDYTFRSRV